MWKSICYTREITQIVNTLVLCLSLQELRQNRIIVLGQERVEDGLLDSIGVTSLSCLVLGWFI